LWCFPSFPMKRSMLLLIVVVPMLTGLPVRGHSAQDAVTDKHVAVLIERMLNADTEQKAFANLEGLGCAAVPAIIRRMDDRRRLPDPQIALRNKSPQAFEGIRHYGPEEVVDALAAILNQMTGQDFGFIYNGAADEERTKAIRGWRKYLETTPAPDLCKAG
jgi:hypothetical protein